jgi:pimeloyl-ACP methyl ester carboxylesterase
VTLQREGYAGGVHWTAYGEGDAVLLLHGLGDDGGCWAPVVPHLPGGRRYVAPDARGHGGSPLPPGPLSATALSAEAAEVLEDVTGPAVVIGHSMGGQTASLLAAEHPDLVRAVVLEDPKFYDASENPAFNPLEGLAHQQRLTLDELVARGRVEERGWPDDEYEPWARSKHRAAPDLVGRELEFRRTRWEDVLPLVRCPLLLVTGDPDRGALVDAATAQEMAHRSGGPAQVAHVPGAGHSIRRDDRPAYAGAVAAFLAARAG